MMSSTGPDRYDTRYQNDGRLVRAQCSNMLALDLREIIHIIRDWSVADEGALRVLALSALTGATVPELLDNRVVFKVVRYSGPFVRVGNPDGDGLTVSANFECIHQQGKLYVQGQRMDMDSGTHTFDADYDCVKPVWIVGTHQILQMIREVRRSQTILQVDRAFDSTFRQRFPQIHQYYRQEGWPLYRFILVGIYLTAITPMFMCTYTNHTRETIVHWVKNERLYGDSRLLRSLFLHQPLSHDCCQTAVMVLDPFEYRHYSNSL